MSRKQLIVIGPLPPPYHGVTVSTSLVLPNRALHELFEIEHVDTSDHRTGGNIGNWDVTNVKLAVLAVARLVRKLHGEPGVVYLPLSQSAPGVLRDSLFVFAGSLRGWKIAAHLRGSEFRGFYRNSNPIMQRWIRATLARVDSIAVMGSSVRHVFDELVPPEKIVVVANGTPEPSATDVRRDPRHVLFLSNLRRSKGVVEAVDAALLVLQRRPSTRFSFVGVWEDAELERELRHKAASADGAITFHQPVHWADKDYLLGSASILLFPPVEPEGHPRVVLEALSAGLPVVTTNRGAIAETVENGRSGFVLADPVPKLLADRTIRLLDDDALREAMGRAARERYLARFTQERADQAIADWLSSIAFTASRARRWTP